MDLLAVGHEVCQDAVVVRAEGDIDSTTVDELTAHLIAALQLAASHPARLLVIDLQPVTFFGSAGLNAVLDCHEQGIAAGTSVRLVAGHGQVTQPIRVTELDRILKIYPTMSEALRTCPPKESEQAR
ncbi:anti-anti-sigma factor [Mycobacterium persicum]|uniref:Anti-sigma factor antagonist n=1 Tax=Mycobacterium persicum TaxID=1487726 RepID=A0A8E2ISJ6_9MYCO|nr:MULTISPECIES: STAS domain-containing protein [Mycobacterium]KZS84897.1 anti-anti-sigma factor [Mycobacterium persicum]ORB49347.1 anti-anti-sigma factor [Mycobacterium persicum]ORB96098.1 anti-anti-sigma factor [Mycobacterium persicum]ORC02806.1 anti-anti-sigma factor [Mycobacterium persicum]ORC08113.1 anti-anti-sigma factor [Mycobacterium persicum]